MIELLLGGSYCLALTAMFGHAILQFHLAWRHRRLASFPVAARSANRRELPYVTVQLPIYNERHLAERVLQSAAALDYPRDRLEIQVLDDSDDETAELLARACALLRHRGYACHHVRRVRREGYKAGALHHALALAKGEYIAIFDADFCPRPDFLNCCLPYFADERVAVVQARWDFLNEGYSLLTRLQAFMLRSHFEMEQAARTRSGYFANFNGTAGVWRKAAILDAGGWRDATLTEDTDLSYRAQLRRWRVHYMEGVGCPSELPVEMAGFRSQQFRWMKGGAENARLHLPAVYTSGLSLAIKAHATAHLCASTSYAALALTLLLAVPLAACAPTASDDSVVDYTISWFVANAALFGSFYEAQGQRTRGVQGKFWFLVMMMLLMTFSAGICLHSGSAAVRGWFGRRSEFVRTPKYGLGNEERDWTSSSYASPALTKEVGLECVFLAYLCAGLWIGWRIHDFSLFPTLLLGIVGLTWVIVGTFCDAYRVRAAARTAARMGAVDHRRLGAELDVEVT